MSFKQERGQMTGALTAVQLQNGSTVVPGADTALILTALASCLHWQLKTI